ncbi:MAG: glycosyltransferase family 4 protein [Candidatus Caldarchaeum sp.]
MKIFTLHTYYQQPGGEDISFQAEKVLLKQMGHEVTPVTFHNQALEDMPPWRKVTVTVWNRQAYWQLRALLQEKRPHIVHVHNTFPFASPAVIQAAKAEGLPVVVTLRNYRLLCVNALLFRQGRVCEDCLGHLPWRGVVHGCYRNSRAASAAVAGMLTFHRFLGTWDMVDRYIVLTEFSRQKFIQAGFPPEKLVVKPNFVHPDPGVGAGKGGYALFVGRLSPEKGVGTLLKAWESLGGRVPLKIVGDGPLAEEVRRAAERMPCVEWLRYKAPEEVYALMGNATVLVFLSEWYEPFGRVAVEAFAKGTPVVASDIGALSELVQQGRTGLLFRPGDPEDLAAKVEWLLAHPRDLARMRQEARAEYEAKYTAERNYQMLMEIYQQAIDNHRKGR